MRVRFAPSPTGALHLENTAGAGGTLGRSFAELAQLLQLAGGGPRLGICLDSCHLFASASTYARRRAWPACSTTSTPRWAWTA